jgi:hypothetical protein
MTRKDYVLIAAALAAAKDCADATMPGNADITAGIALAARYLSADLGRDNPKFDMARFMKAARVDA